MPTDVLQPINPLANPFNSPAESSSKVIDDNQALDISKAIDNWLLEEKKAWERRQNGIKILLLGQSESGKSSVLKNFQLAFVPKTFDAERSAWKIVVYLNVISSLKSIIDVLEEEWQAQDHSEGDITESTLNSFRTLRLSLSPLFLIESNLLRLLTSNRNDHHQIVIRAGNEWKATLHSKTTDSSVKTKNNQDYDPTVILIAQRQDIITLWRNPAVQQILDNRRPSLKRSSGFFMDDIERVTNPDFTPTDADIVRARLRTIGIEEQHFQLERGKEGSATSNDFYIIDVGGARSQRHTWVPFFDDVQCILFLAPLSFNETLEEDRKINKIEDSFQLWKAICRSKLLENIHIILFLNKKDVLAATLNDGVQVKDFVPSYKDRANDIQSVTKYFKDRFQHFHKKYSPQTRFFKCYETSAIDIKSMRMLLFNVRKSMLHDLLTNNEML